MENPLPNTEHLNLAFLRFLSLSLFVLFIACQKDKIHDNENEALLEKETAVDVKTVSQDELWADFPEFFEASGSKVSSDQNKNGNGFSNDHLLSNLGSLIEMNGGSYYTFSVLGTEGYLKNIVFAHTESSRRIFLVTYDFSEGEMEQLRSSEPFSFPLTERIVGVTKLSAEGYPLASRNPCVMVFEEYTYCSYGNHEHGYLPNGSDCPGHSVGLSMHMDCGGGGGPGPGSGDGNGGPGPGSGGGGGGNGSGNDDGGPEDLTPAPGTPTVPTPQSSFNLFLGILSPEVLDWLEDPDQNAENAMVYNFLETNGYNLPNMAFAEDALEAIYEGGEADYINKVILTNEFMDTECLSDIYNELGGATAFQNYLQNFNSEMSVADLTFDADDNFGVNHPKYTDAMALTTPPISSNKMDIVFNTDVSTPGYIKNEPDIFKVVAFMHELLHAEMYRKMLDALIAAEINNINLNWTNWTGDQWKAYIESLDNKYPGILDFYTRYYFNEANPSSTQHQLMAGYYRDAIKDVLADYDPTLTAQQKDALSWLGLNYTDIVAWQNVPPVEQQTINNALQTIENSFPNGCN